jgi:hypothetical protein
LFLMTIIFFDIVTSFSFMPFDHGRKLTIKQPPVKLAEALFSLVPL